MASADIQALRSEIRAHFSERLRDYRTQCGEPSYAALQSISPALSPSTTSDALSGKRAPRWEFVGTFLLTCTEYARRHSYRMPPALDLDAWHADWSALQENLRDPVAWKERASSELAIRELLRQVGPELPDSQRALVEDLARRARRAKGTTRALLDALASVHVRHLAGDPPEMVEAVLRRALDELD